MKAVIGFGLQLEEPCEIGLDGQKNNTAHSYSHINGFSLFLRSKSYIFSWCFCKSAQKWGIISLEKASKNKKQIKKQKIMPCSGSKWPKFRSFWRLCGKWLKPKTLSTAKNIRDERTYLWMHSCYGTTACSLKWLWKSVSNLKNVGTWKLISQWAESQKPLRIKANQWHRRRKKCSRQPKRQWITDWANRHNLSNIGRS